MGLEKITKMEGPEAAFQGVWEDPAGTLFVVDGHTVIRPDGLAMILTILSESKCLYRLGTVKYEGTLIDDRKLFWSDGSEWVRQGGGKEPVDDNGREELGGEVGTERVQSAAPSGAGQGPDGQVPTAARGGFDPLSADMFSQRVPPGGGDGGDEEAGTSSQPGERTHDLRCKMAQQVRAPLRNRIWDIAGQPSVRMFFSDAPYYGWTTNDERLGQSPSCTEDFSSRVDMVLGEVVRCYKNRDRPGFIDAMVRVHDFDKFRVGEFREPLYENQLYATLGPLLEEDGDAGQEFYEGCIPFIKDLAREPELGRGPRLQYVLQVPSFVSEWEKSWDKPFQHPVQLFGAHQAIKQYF